MTYHLPALGICGYSGSGKTTLIEALVPLLSARQLRVAVIKHDCHGLSVDQPGKDSDRFFGKGADVLVQGPDQCFLRVHGAPGSLQDVLQLICAHYDVVLVEGHKTSPLTRKLWLLSDGESAPPPEAGAIDLVLGRDVDRLAIALDWTERALAEVWRRTPVCAGILVGGKASRMRQAKHLLMHNGATWVEHIAVTVQPWVDRIVLVGTAAIPASLQGLPVVPDAPGIEGPLSGMLSAMRWHPTATWLFAACDMPHISSRAVEWLLSSRRPGVWATLPRRVGQAGVEPLLAHYDFRSRNLLEQCRGPADVIRWPQVATPTIPGDLGEAWENINTPEELWLMSEKIGRLSCGV